MSKIDILAMKWRDHFNYDEATGILTWKPRDRSLFTSDRLWRSFNTRVAFTEAGTKDRDAYTNRPARIKVSFHKTLIAAHKIIWEMMCGAIPEGMEIDHVNRNPWDNRLANLRLCTSSQNKVNRKSGINKTGYQGVFLHRAPDLWVARVHKNGRVVARKYERDPAAAHRFYLEKAKEVHGEFFNNDTNRSIEP